MDIKELYKRAYINKVAEDPYYGIDYSTMSNKDLGYEGPSFWGNAVGTGFTALPLAYRGFKALRKGAQAVATPFKFSPIGLAATFVGDTLFGAADRAVNNFSFNNDLANAKTLQDRQNVINEYRKQNEISRRNLIDNAQFWKGNGFWDKLTRLGSTISTGLSSLVGINNQEVDDEQVKLDNIRRNNYVAMLSSKDPNQRYLARMQLQNYDRSNRYLSPKEQYAMFKRNATQNSNRVATNISAQQASPNNYQTTAVSTQSPQNISAAQNSTNRALRMRDMTYTPPGDTSWVDV